MRDHLAVLHGLKRNRLPQSGTQHTLRRGCGQIVAMARACVVGMGMGDDSTVYRTPRVNIKITGRAVQAFGPLNNQVLHVASG